MEQKKGKKKYFMIVYCLQGMRNMVAVNASLV
jgi:hypothetical protein